MNIYAPIYGGNAFIYVKEKTKFKSKSALARTCAYPQLNHVIICQCCVSVGSDVTGHCSLIRSKFCIPIINTVKAAHPQSTWDKKPSPATAEL